MHNDDKLYSLLPVEDFKAILGIEDREDSLSRYCLTTATYAIEQHCMRRLLKKKHHEHIEFTGDRVFPLGFYPVREVLGVWENTAMNREGRIVGPEWYHTAPECGVDEDIPFCLSVSPSLRLIRGVSGITVHYWAGYKVGEVPPDLASACLELAAWYMTRYRGRRIGMTGMVRGSGKDGEHLELSMPENVRQLLEPYRRRAI
jgi:uncharacterized phiE125 gp8 family phage protein